MREGVGKAAPSYGICLLTELKHAYMYRSSWISRLVIHHYRPPSNMSAPSTIRSVLRQGGRTAAKVLTRPGLTIRQQASKTTSVSISSRVPGTARCFTLTTPRTAGIMPETEDPKPPSIETSGHIVQQPTEISDAEYHLHADRFMEALHEEAEKIQETREDVEVEYSVSSWRHTRTAIRSCR